MGKVTKEEYYKTVCARCRDAHSWFENKCTSPTCCIPLDKNFKYPDSIDLLNCGDKNIYNTSFFEGDYVWDIINEK